MKKTLLLAGLGLALAFGAAACKKAEAPAAAVTVQAPQDFAIKGVVRGFQHEGKILIIEHEKIEGLMDAMTMGFELADPAMGKGFKPGDKVMGTLTKLGYLYKITALKKQ